MNVNMIQTGLSLSQTGRNAHYRLLLGRLRANQYLYLTALPLVVPLMMCEGKNTGQLTALFSQGTRDVPPFLSFCR